MTPTSFEFLVTMPGDTRLTGAIRDLAIQAAGYAQQPAATGQEFAGHVARAADIAIAVCGANGAPIEFRFFGDSGTIEVVISCDAGASASAPAGESQDGISVRWTTTDSRYTCHIRQQLSA